MNAKMIRTATILVASIMLAGTATMAQDEGARLTLSTGMDYTTGRYGGDADIDDLYVPVTGTFSNGRYAARLTIPYLSVDAPAGTVIDPGGQPLPGSGEMTTASGLGDVSASVTALNIVNNRRLGLAMDLTAKVKFGTADENVGLGTGENDYTLQAEFYKFADALTLLSTIGYKLRGDPQGIDLEDVWMASIGGAYRVSSTSRVGLGFDYRQSALTGSESIRELSGFISRHINDSWALQVYAFTGFSDSSPDLGAGILLKRTMYPR
jgi:hypothetical protein